MKNLLIILFLVVTIKYLWADEISSNGLICNIEQDDSKRVTHKKLIYHFDNGIVYAVQVDKQNFPITINKILISQYSYDNEQINWEGENSAKTIKYYATLNKENHILNLEYFFVSGSKTENNTKKSLYCSLMSWDKIEATLSN